MALKLSELRKRAKDMGISPAVIRQATTAEELQSVIEDNETHDGGTKVVVRKKVQKKSRVTTQARKPARKPAARSKPAARRKPAGNSARKASTPAKSRTRGTAKRSSTNSERKSYYVPKGGRNVLDDVEYGDFEGWNPRLGSAPDRIIKALKKFRGDRTKVFDFLADDVWAFVGKTKRNGQKRTKAEAMEMLSYRISRTAWDFAMRTGQHDVAGNRVKYGTGGTGQGVWKPAKARKATATRKAAAGRKPAAARKAKTTTARSVRAAGGRRKPAARKRTTARR